MKKIYCFLLSLLLIISLASCSEEVKTLNNGNNGDIASRIVLVYKGVTDGDIPVRIYADSKTKVMYLYMGFSGYRAGFSIMEDSEGNPLLWED